MEKLEEYRWPLFNGMTISLFFLYFYIKGRFLGGSELYNFLDLTFGVYYYLLVLYPLILGTSAILNNKSKETALKIRLFSGLLFFFFCTFFLIMRELESSALIGVNLEQELVRRSWTELNLGGASTAIIHYLYFNVDKTILYRVVLGVIGVTAFILFTKNITNLIRGIFRLKAEYLERKALKKKEAELQAKIEIKEKIDEDMALKKKKNLKQHEEKIQKEVEKFMEKSGRDPKETATEKPEEKQPPKDDQKGGVVVSLEELVEQAKKQKEMSGAAKEEKIEVLDNESEKISEEASKEETPVSEEKDSQVTSKDIENEEIKEIEEPLKDEEIKVPSSEEKVNDISI